MSAFYQVITVDMLCDRFVEERTTKCKFPSLFCTCEVPGYHIWVGIFAEKPNLFVMHGKNGKIKQTCSS